MHRLGVCSWSLRPTGPEDLVAKIQATGLAHCQLALEPIRSGRWDEMETTAALRRAGITVVSGMMEMEGEDYATLDSIRATGGVRPDATWPGNLAKAAPTAALAQRLGLRLVSFHAGFLPHAAGAAERDTMLGRLRQLAAAFAPAGVQLALETGQEDAQTLLGVLAELAGTGIGVNFDPANMILYGMGDPVAALAALAPHVRQAHVKDALPAARAGTWGSEVPVGTGAVPWPEFLRRIPRGIDLLIEREAGTERIADVRKARQVVAGLLPEAAR